MTHPAAPDIPVGPESSSRPLLRPEPTASQRLRVLVLEPGEQSLPWLDELGRRGLDVHAERLSTFEAMRDAIATEAFHLVLVFDESGLAAPTALELLRERGLELPVLLVAESEENGTLAMKAGARDYFLAGAPCPRFAPAVAREVADAATRATYQKQIDRLMISDRISSMGTLVAGVAHEINNPLASVMANLDLAAHDMADLASELDLTTRFATVVEELRDAHDATDRIRTIVRDLKLFSYTESDKEDRLDVDKVMESALRLSWSELRHRAKLVKTYGGPPKVLASESRLGLVFLNLVLNAAQAIAEGRAERHEIRIHTGTDAGGRVVVEVADTGPGMTKEVMDRLFTPFFTTKLKGGSGLGLSISRRIVISLGGTIDVQSAPGLGSLFRVTLPAAPVEAAPARVAAVPSAGLRGRVMVVDDEPMLARVLQRTLSPEHEVVALTLAAEALQRIVSGERYDVILCDLMMPQMTGMDLYDEIRRVAEDQAERMVFLTGEAFTPRARAFLEETPNQRLEKPFDTRHLRAVVNERARRQKGDDSR